MCIIIQEVIKSVTEKKIFVLRPVCAYWSLPQKYLTTRKDVLLSVDVGTMFEP